MLKIYAKRRRRGQFVPTGTLVADCDTSGDIRIGWSKCHTSLDRFTRKEGTKLAMQRFTDENWSANITKPATVVELCNKLPHDLHFPFWKLMIRLYRKHGANN